MSRLTVEERHLMRAVSLQHHARTQLAVAEWHTSPEEVEQAKRTLAEGLAMAGDFREAADLHPDGAQALRFAQIADAIEKPDKACDCVPAEAELNGEKITTHPRFVSERVYSKKHGGKLMPLIRCRECGDENVRALGTATAERSAAVTKAMREAHRA